MIPVLFEIRLFGWDLALPTYGTLLAVAFLAALWVALRQARRVRVDVNVVTDLWIVSLISGVLGAKVLLYLLDLDHYLANPWEIVRSLRSAGVFYGGLIAAIAACVIVVRRRGLDAWVIGDVLAPAIMLGQSIGRWGCFAAGCCYGKPTDLPWAVTFTDPRAHRMTDVPLNIPLHPTQLYLSLADLGAFFILTVVAARKKFHGQVLLLYLILYAILRGTLETFRDDPRGSLAGLSTSQWLSIAAGLISVALYVMRSRDPQAAVEPAAKGRGKPAQAGKSAKEASAP